MHRRALLTMGPCALAACFGARAQAQDSRRPDEDGVGTVWWVEVVTSNDGPAMDFYRSTLAWSAKRTPDAGVDKAQPVATSAYTLFEANGTDVAGGTVALKVDIAKSRPMWIVYFRVDNVEKAIARALDRGGKLLLAPYDVAGSARMAILADLDGLTFGIATPL